MRIRTSPRRDSEPIPGLPATHLATANPNQEDVGGAKETEEPIPAPESSLTPLEKARLAPKVWRSPLEKAALKPKSLRLAITAKCWECAGSGQDPLTRAAIRDCSVCRCPLHPVRPFQKVRAHAH